MNASARQLKPTPMRHYPKTCKTRASPALRFSYFSLSVLLPLSGSVPWPTIPQHPPIRSKTKQDFYQNMAYLRASLTSSLKPKLGPILPIMLKISREMWTTISELESRWQGDRLRCLQSFMGVTSFWQAPWGWGGLSKKRSEYWSALILVLYLSNLQARGLPQFDWNTYNRSDGYSDYAKLGARQG